MNTNLEKGKYKDGKPFAGSVIVVHPKINMTVISKNNFSLFESIVSLAMALFTHKNAWYFNLGITNYLYNACDIFIIHTKFTISQVIEGIGRSISFLGKSMIRLNVQLTD